MNFNRFDKKLYKTHYITYTYILIKIGVSLNAVKNESASYHIAYRLYHPCLWM